jgi:hypothetical protein
MTPSGETGDQAIGSVEIDPERSQRIGPADGIASPSVPLDDALAASRFQAAAELRRLIERPERTDHGAVVDALVAEVGTLDQGAARSQHPRKLVLQSPVGRLGVEFAAL